jgi:hypothetical protein
MALISREPAREGLLAQLWKTSGGKTGMIFTVDAHAERELFRILVKGIRSIPGFHSFDFYNAVFSFSVAGKVWRRDWTRSDRRES